MLIRDGLLLSVRPVPDLDPRRIALLAAVVLGLVLGLDTAATVVLLVLAAAASLEAFAGLCLGCEIFRLGMRAGLVPETVCLECADIWSRGRANA